MISNYLKSNLLENIISLSLWQLITNILKFIWVPYIVRVLGINNYGIFVIAQTISFYLISISDYGFNITATRDISINRNNREKISNIFTTVLASKILLLILNFIILILFIFISKKLQENIFVYIYSFGIVIGNSLFPLFIFQGLEKMKYITYIDTISKLLSIILIFIFVKSNNDLEKFCLIFSFGYILSGLIGIISAIFLLKINIYSIKIKDIFFQLKEGFNIFIGNIITNIINQTNPIIIGFYLNNELVAIYGIADKLRVLFISLYSPIINSFYSRVSYIFEKDKRKYFNYIKKVEYIIMFISVLLILIINNFSEIIITILFGNNFEYSSFILKIFSISILINSLGFIYSNLFLSASNNNKYIRTVYIYGIFIYLLLLIFIIFFKKINLINLSINLIISELFIVSFFYHKYYIYKNNIKKEFKL